MNEKTENEALETEIEIVNETSATAKNTDPVFKFFIKQIQLIQLIHLLVFMQMIYHNLPLELKIGQMPNQETDIQTYYMVILFCFESYQVALLIY